MRTFRLDRKIILDMQFKELMKLRSELVVSPAHARLAAEVKYSIELLGKKLFDPEITQYEVTQIIVDTLNRLYTLQVGEVFDSYNYPIVVTMISKLNQLLIINFKSNCGAKSKVLSVGTCSI